MECHCGQMGMIECAECDQTVCLDHTRECHGCTQDFCDECLENFSNRLETMCKPCFKKYKGKSSNVNQEDQRQNRRQQLADCFAADLEQLKNTNPDAYNQLKNTMPHLFSSFKKN